MACEILLDSESRQCYVLLLFAVGLNDDFLAEEILMTLESGYVFCTYYGVVNVTKPLQGVLLALFTHSCSHSGYENEIEPGKLGLY